MITHPAWPLRLGLDGQFVTHVQDSVDDLASQAELLLSTPVGDRAVPSSFGVPDQTGSRDIDTSLVEGALDDWVPGARAAGVTASIDADGVARVTVEVAG